VIDQAHFRSVESQTLLAIGSIPTGRAIPGGPNMTYTAFAPTRPAQAIPLREWLPWAFFAGLILLLAIYFVGAEQGATSLISGKYVHEFVHDGRHLLGFPCH
jgi:hypothetical protein